MTNLETRKTRKRHRLPLACEQCRQRKLKCNREHPCQQCIKSKSTKCTYIHDDRLPPPTVSKASQAPVGLRNRPVRNEEPSVMQDGAGNSQEPLLLSNNTSHSQTWSSLGLAPIDSNSMTRIGPDWNFNHDRDNLDTPYGSVSSIQQQVSPGLQGSTVSKQLNNGRFAVPKRLNLNPGVGLIKGVFAKERYFGPSHWMNACENFDYIFEVARMIEEDDNTEILDLFKKCKKLGRQIKAQTPWQKPIPADFREYIPSRQISDSLVDNYLRTWEGVYRILHVPSFKREYEAYRNNPATATTPFIITLLLVLAIGTCFERDQELRDNLRNSSMQWIYAAQSWLNYPFSEKSRINVTGIQIHCLLLFARETNKIGADLTWISAGSLLRTAMFVGMHRDPAYIPDVTTIDAEIRRRLWATILEITLESCITAGGSPLLSLDDFDTLPPSNLNDDELERPEEQICALKSVEERYTDTNCQIMLLKMFPIRLKVARTINSLKSRLTHLEAIEIGRQFDKEFFRIRHSLAKHTTKSPQMKQLEFQAQFIRLIHARFTLLVHHPFAVRAIKDPTYHYSRSICQSRALDILLQCGTDVNKPLDQVSDVYCLVLLGSGMFRSLMLHACLVLGLELWSQIKESIFSPNSEYERRSWKEMWDALEIYTTHSAERIKHGETNIKGYVFVSIILASLKAMMHGEPSKEIMLTTTKSCLRSCESLLQEKVAKTNASSIINTPISPMNQLELGVPGISEGNFTTGISLFEDFQDWDEMDYGFRSDFNNCGQSMWSNIL